MDRAVRRIIVSVGVIAAVFAVDHWRPPTADAAEHNRFGQPLRQITPEIRARGLRIESGVAPKDRAWILAAIAHARPEAQKLIGEVDGLVTITTRPGGDALPGGQAVGVTRPSPNGFGVELNVAALDGDASFSRDVVVLHELGHVIDFSLIDQDLANRLDTTIPSSGACVSEGQISGACTAPEERFADTFAKWALRGAVSAAGAGYRIRAPLLDEWAQPLAIMAAQAGTT